MLKVLQQCLLFIVVVPQILSFPMVGMFQLKLKQITLLIIDNSQTIFIMCKLKINIYLKVTKCNTHISSKVLANVIVSSTIC